LKKLKRHPESRSLLFKLGLSLFVLAAVAAGLFTWLVFFTSTFTIKAVEITGSRIRSVQYVREESGIDAYRNIVTLPAAKISGRLEQDPWIKEARVGRRLPHTVTITVTERKPVALVDCNGAFFLVDGSGWTISPAGPTDFPQLPRVNGGSMSTPKVAARVADRRVVECIGIMSQMSESMRGNIVLANPFDGRGHVFVTRMGFQIVYGSSAEARRKNEILEAIILDAKKNDRHAEYVDVSVPDSPVIKLKHA
jgi:cell division protein FtsQ